MSEQSQLHAKSLLRMVLVVIALVCLVRSAALVAQVCFAISIASGIFGQAGEMMEFTQRRIGQVKGEQGK